MSKKFTFIDFFSGVGGFRVAAEKNGGRSIGFSEVDKPAIAVYEKNFRTSKETAFGDITQLKKLPYADMYFGGVPCQSWSIAGSKKGFDDPRGKLWEDTIRVTRLNQPRVFVYENVKGLYDPRNRDNLDLLLREFKKAGYRTYFKLLNAFDFGLPQNRERIFLVGIRKDILPKKDFEFPRALNKNPSLSDIIDDFKDKKIAKRTVERDLLGDRVSFSPNFFQTAGELNDFFIFCDTRDGHTSIHSWDIKRSSQRDRDICLTVLKNRRKSKYGPWDGNPLSYEDLKELIPDLKAKELDKLVDRNFLKKEEDGRYELRNTKNSAGIDGVYRVFLPQSPVFSTITATENRDYIATKKIPSKDKDQYKKAFIEKIYKKNNLRLITGREAARLQGFPDKFDIDENDRLAKKQFGNAVPVNVVNSIIGELMKQKFIN